MTKQNLFCLYMGAEPLEVEFKDGTTRKVVGISIYEDMIQVLDNDGNTDWWNISPDCTALLYDLSDITDEDAVEANFLPPNNTRSGNKDFTMIKVVKEKDGVYMEYKYRNSIEELNNDDGFSYSSDKLYFYRLTWQQVDYLRLHHYCTNEAYWKNGWAKRRVRG